jgi:hypothetical protein
MAAVSILTAVTVLSSVFARNYLIGMAAARFHVQIVHGLGDALKPLQTLHVVAEIFWQRAFHRDHFLAFRMRKNQPGRVQGVAGQTIE